MPILRRFGRARLGVLALTAVLLLAVDIAPVLARPTGQSGPGVRDWLSRAVRALVRRDDAPAAAMLGEVVAYGPIQATTPTGTSTTRVESFSLPAAPSGQRYQLKVENGSSTGTLRATSGSVVLNGATVVTSAELTAIATGASLRKPIFIKTTVSNTLSATVAGVAGSYITLSVVAAPDSTFTVFSKTYQRASGQAVTVTDQFTLPAGAGLPRYLYVTNGNGDGTANSSSATVLLNGVEVVGTANLSGTVQGFVVPVTLQQTNTVATKLMGSTGTKLTLRFVATDSAKPVLTVTAPAVGLVTNLTSVTATGTVADQTAVGVTVTAPGQSVAATLTTNSGVTSYSAPLNLSEGSNAITIRAVDGAGNTTDSTRTVIRDTQAPTVQITSLPDTASYTADSTAVVAGTILDATRVTANLNGVAVPIDSVTHAFSRTVALAQGANFLTLVATDAAGNATTVVRQVTRNNAPPTLTVTTPTDSQFTNQPLLQVSGTASAPGGVRVTIQGAPVTVAASGQFQKNLPLSEGANTVTVVATGANGLSRTTTRTVTLDTIPPVFTISSPAEGYVTTGPFISVSGTVSEPAHVTGGALNSTFEFFDAMPGSFSYQLDSDRTGPIEFTFTAADRAGNGARIVRVVTFDDVPPTIVLSTPAAGATSRTPAYHVTGTVTDATALAVTVNGTATTVGAGGAFDAVVTLADGANAITVVATDAAGNQSQATGSVLLDAAPPVVTLTSPATALTVTNAATITVTGTAADQTGASVLVNGVAATLDGAGAFSVPVTLAAGANTITILVTDGVGNITTVVRTVDLDTQAPALDVATPQNGALAQSGTVSVSGIVTDAHDATVSANGTALVVIAGGAFSGSIAAPADRVVTVTATDAAGNVTTVTRTLGVADALPPDPATVAPPLNRTVATTMATSTAFLYDGPNPIQTGVVAGTITDYQAAVVRGRVITPAGAPLSGVTVTVHGRPELGQTISRADGGYDLAVNGGDVLTVNYAKTGVLAAQRQQIVPRQQWATLEDVALVPLDTAVTTVDLTQPGTHWASGSTVTDTSGTRQVSLRFAAGTQATMTLADGSTQPLTAIGVRATEFTRGRYGYAAMPADLPPASAYTYAMEVSVDAAIAVGARGVQFSKPVTAYVNNFLHVPAGTVVPMGRYDRDSHVWVPQPNGRVITILSTDSGKVKLDVDGSGIPATPARLEELGITPQEQADLADRYPTPPTPPETPPAPPPSVTRFEIDRTGVEDANYPKTNEAEHEKPPVDPPKDDAQDKPKPDDKKPDDGCADDGSIIGCDRRTLGEEIPVAGTPLRLTYTSERMPGYRPDFSYDVPLSDKVADSLLARMTGIVLRARAAGRVSLDTFPAQRGLHGRVTWDGLDAYGRRIQGPTRLTIEVGYIYGDTKYGAPVNDSVPAFGRASGSLLGVTTRMPTTRWRTVLDRVVGGWENTTAGLGGWSLSAHHAFDPTTGAMYLGNGDRRTPASLGPTLDRAATGRAYSMFVEPDGSIVTAYGRQVLRLRRDGTSQVVAGNGQLSFSGDGGPATAAGMEADVVTRAPDGSIYIGDKYNMRLRRVDAQTGIITTVAGNGTCGDSGDGLPVAQARFCSFDAIAFGPDGSLYVAAGPRQYRPWRVRRIGPDGIVTHFAGSLMYQSCDYTFCQGDYFEDSLATVAAIGRVAGIGFMPDGSMLIADGYSGASAVIWKVRPDGIRTRFAGTGGGTGGGDGLPAREANFAGIINMAVAPDGTVYVATQQYVVRRISPRGIMTTVAGNGKDTLCGYQGSAPCPPSGASALAMGLPVIYSLAVSAENALYIGEGWQSTIFRLSHPLPDPDANVGTPGRDSTGYNVASADGSVVDRFDLAGRHVSTRDARSGVTVRRFTYDSAGRLATITDTLGNVTTLERAADGSPQAIVAPDGQRTTLTLDARGYLASVRAPGGERTGFGYDSLGLMKTLIEVGGAVHQFTYAPSGLLESDRGPDGLVQTLASASTADGKEVTVSIGATQVERHLIESLPAGGYRRVTTDAAGLATTTTVTAGDSATMTRPDGTVMTRTLSSDPRFGAQAPLTRTTVRMPSGLTNITRTARAVTLATPSNPLSVLTQVDSTIENGAIWTRRFDAVARTVTSRSAEGRLQVVTLDSLGRAATMVSGGVGSAGFQYDARGHVRQFTFAGRVSRFDHDALGRIEWITDPTGARTHVTRDSLGRILSVQDTAGTVAYSYDSTGHLGTLTPAGRPAHQFRYTPGGLLREYEAPSVTGVLGTITRYRYDQDQQLRAITRASGDSITLQYDAAGRPTAVATADDTTSLGYAPSSGMLTSVGRSDGGSYTLGYDGALLKSITLSRGTMSGTVAFGYDAFLRRNLVAVNGDTVRLAYDRDGLVTSAGALVVGRDPTTRRAETATLGGVVTSYRYDSTGVLAGATTTANGAAVYAYDLERDLLDRVVRKTETVGGVTTETRFAYDSASRLSTVTRDGATVAAYEYDANGNRLRRTTTAGVDAGVFDAQDRLTAYAGASYGYTDAGELRRRVVGNDTTEYHHDAAGVLRWVRRPDGSRIDYVIDPMGKRIGTQVDGVLTQRFVYESELRIAAELTPAGDVLTRFVYDGAANVPAYLVRAGQRYRLVTDAVGSVRLVVDVSTGQVAQRIDYDEYGQVVQNTNPGFQPFGYAGGLLDDRTGLVRFGAREYDAGTGRFTTKDPIGFASGSTNLYSYVANDPINFVDPTGLWRLPDYISGAVSIGIKNPFTGNFVGWSGTVAVDRYGDMFWSPTGAAASYPPGTSLSGMANWLDMMCTPSRQKLKDFLSQSGYSVTGGYGGLGLSQSYTPGSGFATGVGLSTPGVSGNYNYSFPVGNAGFSW